MLTEVCVVQVERLVANAGPAVEKAAHKAKATAHLHLSNIRDRQQDGWETPPGVLVTPKVGGTTRKLSTQQVDFRDPAAAAAASSATPQPQQQTGARWLGGLGSYFSAGAREERDKTFYTEERIVCFPGVSKLSVIVPALRRLTRPLGPLPARYPSPIDALSLRTSPDPRCLRS